jgi:hypothetical protein
MLMRRFAAPLLPARFTSATAAGRKRKAERKRQCYTCKPFQCFFSFHVLPPQK